MIKKILYITVLLFNFGFALDLNIEKERKVDIIGAKIHCPICNGESIAQSQTDISRQMINVVRTMVSEGKSEQEILNYFSERYGERILLDPPKKGVNIALWAMPLVLAAAGFWAWNSYIQSSIKISEQLTPEEESRISDILKSEL